MKQLWTQPAVYMTKKNNIKKIIKRTECIVMTC